MRASEVWTLVQHQAAAHGVQVTPAIRGVFANVLQVVLGEWAWEHEELERLRDFRDACQLAVGGNATLATVYAELADLERFYDARRTAEVDSPE